MPVFLSLFPGHNSPTAQTFTLPHPQRLVQDLSCVSWTCLAFLLAFMTLRLTTLSLPSMLAFAALHCLARASSLPMASFIASPHAEFVLTEPASAESDASPHFNVFYEKSVDLANLAFDSLPLFYETESTFSTCPASAAGTPYASLIADSSIGLNVPPHRRTTTGDPILEPPTLSPTTWATSRTCCLLYTSPSPRD